MILRMRFIVFSLLACLVTAVSAQSVTCPLIVEQALTVADDACQDLGRNQACYGNIYLEAQPQGNVPALQFDQVGDIVDLQNIESIQLSALDEEQGHWGISILRVQANIPDTLPGQNVTFVLFGDVSIRSATTPGQNPMQAFYLQTGVGESRCQEAPQNGMLVQTPDGVDEVLFNINGTDVRIGSTVLFQAVAGEEMRLTTVEGTALVDVAGKWFPAVQGTWLRLPVGDNLLPTSFPWLPERYDAPIVAPLPVTLLEREIEIAPPLPDDVYDVLLARVLAGEAPCGVDGLPDCDRFEDIDSWGGLEHWGRILVPGVNCALPGAPSSGLAPCPQLRSDAPVASPVPSGVPAVPGSDDDDDDDDED